MNKLFQWLLIMLISVVITVGILSTFFIIKIADTYAMTPTIRLNDVVVFKKKPDRLRRFDIVLLDQNSRRSIVRVIGLPGENILYSNDRLYVNGTLQPEPFIDNEKNNSQLFGGLYTANFSVMSINKTSEIPANHYLVLYDNRFMDNDSRTYGLVDRKYIKGVRSGFFST